MMAIRRNSDWRPPANRSNQTISYHRARQTYYDDYDKACRDAPGMREHVQQMIEASKTPKKVNFVPQKPVLKITPDDIFSIGNRVAILPRTLYEKERRATVSRVEIINRGLTQKLWVKLDGSQRELVYHYPGEVRKLEHRITVLPAMAEGIAA